MAVETNQNPENMRSVLSRHHKWLWGVLIAIILASLGVSFWFWQNKMLFERIILLDRKLDNCPSATCKKKVIAEIDGLIEEAKSSSKTYTVEDICNWLDDDFHKHSPALSYDTRRADRYSKHCGNIRSEF